MSSKNDARKHKHARVRKKISGTAARPRLVVSRTLKHITAQLIDDDLGVTLASASTLNKGVEIKSTGNQQAARKIGALLAERAKAAGLAQVVFDRGGNLYHGRVKALAEGAREGGLQF